MTRTEAERQYREASLTFHRASLRFYHAENAVYEARGCRYATRTRSNTTKRLHVRNQLALIDAETHRQALAEIGDPDE